MGIDVGLKCNHRYYLIWWVLHKNFLLKLFEKPVIRVAVTFRVLKLCSNQELWEAYDVENQGFENKNEQEWVRANKSQILMWSPSHGRPNTWIILGLMTCITTTIVYMIMEHEWLSSYQWCFIQLTNLTARFVLGGTNQLISLLILVDEYII